MKKAVCFLATSVLIGGCHLQSQKTVELVPTREIAGRGELISTPSQIRMITVKDKAASYIICSEPGPDTALSDTFKMITGITSDTSTGLNSGTGQSATASEKMNLQNDLQTSTTALELAGRTQTVLLAREFLYRTCEAAANGWLSEKDVKEAHMEVIKQITGLIKTDQKKAETTAAVATLAASGKLNPELLGNATEAVRGAITDACLSSYESCVNKTKKTTEEARETDKCKSELKKCLP